MEKTTHTTSHPAWTRIAMLALGLLTCHWSHAQSPAEVYPNRPVKVMVGYGPGGTGASQVAQQAPPDGYTLNFIAAGNFAMTPSLFKSSLNDTRGLIAHANANPGKQ
jgi:tripartite-type tricarboxylate transporter receptor subunit TctC